MADLKDGLLQLLKVQEVDKEIGALEEAKSKFPEEIALRQAEIDACATDAEKHSRLCELNVVEQVANVCYTSIVQNAWKSGQPVTVHGWIYDIGDGVLKDLDVCITGPEEVALTHRMK